MSTNYILNKNTGNCFSLLVRYWISHYPLCEIVEKHHKILVSTRSEGKLGNINSYTVKWTSNGYRLKKDGLHVLVPSDLHNLNILDRIFAHQLSCQITSMSYGDSCKLFSPKDGQHMWRNDFRPATPVSTALGQQYTIDQT